jgi:hypothetical protein
MSWLSAISVDDWTLMQSFERGSIFIECGRCRRLAQIDIQPLVYRFGPDATLGALQARLKCDRCDRREAQILVHLQGIRGDKAWRPRPPRAGR